MHDIPTIAQAAALLAAKELSPVELLRASLDRTERLDGSLHAFLLKTPERALEDARASELRFMRGEPFGRLDGIPIGHKDIIETAGVRTTANSRLLEHHVPTTDATVVQRLAAAGAVMVGKLATHEFALGGPSADLPWPIPRNPWDTDRYAGGSSSGTAVAVASGMILGGTGSDTGGSIRGPSALCGLTGLKPTYGLVSRKGVLPLSFGFDHVGPMAWTAEDCAILLGAMAGHDPADAASVRCSIPDYTVGIDRGAGSMRIGFVRHFHERDTPISQAAGNALEAAVEVFADLGAEIVDVTLSPLQDYSACGWIIQLVEGFAIHEPWLQTRFRDYGAVLRERLAIGGLLSGSAYVQALRKRRTLCQEMAEAMERLDLLVVAGQADEAVRLVDAARWPMLETPSLTIPFNVAGVPAMSVPIGFGPGGLPLGMQIVAKPFQEDLLFQAAHAFQNVTRWLDARPGPPAVGGGRSP